MSRDLRALPKAHLHLHMEGAMRPSTLADLTTRYGLPPPPEPDGSFATFIRTYRQARDGLRSADDLHRLVDEVVADAAADGAVWVEPSEWIASWMPERTGLADVEAVLRVLLEALEDAAGVHGIGAGLMVSTNRVGPPAEAEELARLGARYAGRGVVSFGLADDEVAGAPEPFAEAFAIARAAGLIAAPHAGELAGPESVRGALDALGARRLQHGVRAVEDPALLERLAREQVCLDVCLTSNVYLRVVPSLEEHPLPRLLAAGIPVSLNTDDPLVFGSSLLGEYEIARRVFNLDDRTLAGIAASSIRASGAPDALKAASLAGVERWLATGSD
jgi:adenosine deaminase